MKSLMLTFCIFFVSVASSWGQIKVTIKEESKAMSLGTHNCLVMELPGASAKDVDKAWKGFAKRFKGKTKFDRKMNEHFVDDGTIKEMSDNTVDIVAKIEERGAEGAAISVWFNLGVSYLSSKDFPDRYPFADKIMKDFANEVSAEMILEELKVQEKILKEKEKELEGLEKSKTGLEKDIEGYKETIKKMEESITKAEGDIKQNVEEQGGKKVEIEEQQKIIEEIKQRLETVKK